MKIIHLNHSDNFGGAARAAYRIHCALLVNDVESRMRVLHGGTGDASVQVCPAKPIAKRVWDNLHQRLEAHRHRGWQTENRILHSFGRASAHLVEELNNSDADILHLHWVSGMLSVADIGRLRKPIVWTLHDMWAFCGAEHYAPDDAQARFRVGYLPNNRPNGERGPDLNRQTWEAKRRAWAHQRFTLISPSQWLADCVRGSALMGKHPVHVLPNPVDISYPWRPVPQDVARIALGLPRACKLVLMGAEGGVMDPRKGGYLLRAAVTQLVEQTRRTAYDVRLAIYGQANGSSGENWPCPVHWLGVVNDDRVLALANAAADVLVVPSKQDNLPNTALEAQACGTPVVAFDVGGLPDIVVHGETGWLAQPFDVQDLAKGIIWAISRDRTKIERAVRDDAEAKFSPTIVANKLTEIYRRVVDNQS